MNKFTTTLAGLALVAGVSIAPAMANNGIFQPSGAASPVFSFTTTGYALYSAPVTYFSSAGAVDGLLSLTGTGLETGSSYVYDNTSLFFTPTGGAAEALELGKSIVTFSGGDVTFSSFGTFTAGVPGTQTGDRYDLNYAPVPEASTVVSFGVLLALGGLAVLRRKSVKTAA
jgi:hypothetical protein